MIFPQKHNATEKKHGNVLDIVDGGNITKRRYGWRQKPNEKLARRENFEH